jgi:hypothetical protein
MRVLKACGGVLVFSLWATDLPCVWAEVFVCVQPGASKSTEITPVRGAGSSKKSRLGPRRPHKR